MGSEPGTRAPYNVDDPDHELHEFLAQTGHRVVSAEVVAAIRDIFDAEQDEAMPETVAELVYKHYDLVRAWLNTSPPSPGVDLESAISELVRAACSLGTVDRVSEMRKIDARITAARQSIRDAFARHVALPSPGPQGSEELRTVIREALERSWGMRFENPLSHRVSGDPPQSADFDWMTDSVLSALRSGGGEGKG